MSVRLSVLGLLLLAFCMLLLLNIDIVPVRIYFYDTKLPLSSIMLVSSLFGAGLSLLFVSLSKRERRLKSKIINYEELERKKRKVQNNKQTSKS